MQPEIPARGILKQSDYGDSIWYRIACDCGCEDHDHVMNVVADDHGVGVEIYVNISTSGLYPFKYNYDINNGFLSWFDCFWKDVYNGLVTRLKYTRDIWTKGRIRADTYLILDKQQSLNYADTIKRAIHDVSTLQPVKENKDD
jgi:hypothetical protein